jgi:hypothetical protein
MKFFFLKSDPIRTKALLKVTFLLVTTTGIILMKKCILPSLDELYNLTVEEFSMRISLLGFMAFFLYYVMGLLTDAFADINLKDFLMGEFKIVRSPRKLKTFGEQEKDNLTSSKNSDSDNESNSNSGDEIVSNDVSSGSKYESQIGKNKGKGKEIVQTEGEISKGKGKEVAKSQSESPKRKFSDTNQESSDSEG